MNDFSHILLMTDLDGTFFGPHASLVQRNLDAVERFKARGGHFTLATGRTWHNLINVIPCPEAIANAPLSLGNGCCFFDAGERKPIVDYFLPAEPAAGMARFIRERFPDLGLRISFADGFLLEPDDRTAFAGISTVAPEYLHFLPRGEWDGKRWYKIIAVGVHERLELLRDTLRRERGGEGVLYEFDRPGTRLLEIHPTGCGKASMIGLYRRYFAERGVTELTVCAAGDFDNDLEMLRHADVAMCPANAADAVKDVCRYTFCHCRDGAIADFIDLLAERDGQLGG